MRSAKENVERFNYTPLFCVSSASTTHDFSIIAAMGHPGLNELSIYGFMDQPVFLQREHGRSLFSVGSFEANLKNAAGIETHRKSCRSRAMIYVTDSAKEKSIAIDGYEEKDVRTFATRPLSRQKFATRPRERFSTGFSHRSSRSNPHLHLVYFFSSREFLCHRSPVASIFHSFPDLLFFLRRFSKEYLRDPFLATYAIDNDLRAMSLMNLFSSF